ncbi:MAG: DMT family transporter [Oscillospiraceae bacterium]|nr:DMT family transporter [Oscillospiraceae bacterium]
MKKETTRARLCLIASMSIFGTIGILRHYLPVPSGFLAMFRGLAGTLFLLLVDRVRGRQLSRKAVSQSLLPLCVSGVLMGLNWILMFEAYRFTSVATATLCYYMAPVFTLLAAPFVLHERLTLRKIICVAAALFGMFLVSGAAYSGSSGSSGIAGVLCALGAAVLYAAVVLMNKRICGVPASDKTIVQLGTAGVVLIPYVLLTGELSQVELTPSVAVLLLVAGLVHTGLSYSLYFASTDYLPAHTLALLSYLDPIIAVLLSALLLREPMSPLQGLGAVLIIAAAAVAELPEHKGKQKETTK